MYTSARKIIDYTIGKLLGTEALDICCRILAFEFLFVYLCLIGEDFKG